MCARSRDPRTVQMPYDESWPWRTDIPDDPAHLPGGFSTREEAQKANDSLERLWGLLTRVEKRAFLQWFSEDGPDHWPPTEEECHELADALTEVRDRPRWWRRGR